VVALAAEGATRRTTEFFSNLFRPRRNLPELRLLPIRIL
jgi:hypothetical protein